MRYVLIAALLTIAAPIFSGDFIAGEVSPGQSSIPLKTPNDDDDVIIMEEDSDYEEQEEDEEETERKEGEGE